MKAEDIRKHIKGLNIGPEDDIAALTDDLTKQITQDNDDMSGAIEALDEFALEINERLSQVEDEDRIAELERKLKLVEDTSAALAKMPPKETKHSKSVLVADDSAERLEDPKKNRPVALDASELAASEKAADKKAEDNKTGGKAGEAKEDEEKKSSESEKSGFFGIFKGSDKDDKEKQLEKKAGELIKKKQKEQEEERKRLEKEQKQQNTQNAGDNNGGSASGQGNDQNGNSGNDASADGSNGGQSQSSSGSMDSRLAAALKNYYDRKYAKAREELRTLANAKDLSKEDISTAKFFYGKMLENGEGGPVDADAAKFWMEAAAKMRNVDALMWVGRKYAEMTPSSAADNVEITAKALKNFKKADKAQAGGNDIAKNKYIDICENKPIYRSAKNTACGFCDDLAEKQNDAYEKKKFDDKKELIKKNFKSNNAAKFSGSGTPIKDIRDIFVILGALLTLFGDYAVFMTVNNRGSSLPKFIEINGASTGSLSGFWGILSESVASFVESFCDEICKIDIELVLPGTLLSGLLIFLAGRLLVGLETYQARGRITEIFCEVALAATLLTVFGMVAAYVFAVFAMQYLFASFAIAIFMVLIMIIAKIVMIPFKK